MNERSYSQRKKHSKNLWCLTIKVIFLYASSKYVTKEAGPERRDVSVIWVSFLKPLSVISTNQHYSIDFEKQIEKLFKTLLTTLESKHRRVHLQL